MLVAEILTTYGITQQELSDATGISRDKIAKWATNKANPKAEDTGKLRMFVNLVQGKTSHEVKAGLKSLRATIDENFGADRYDIDLSIPLNNTLAEGDRLRNKKAFGDRKEDDEDGIIAVPIGAQAGGARYYEDPVFANQLEVYKLPGMPYRGRKYRMFQVDGDSMEYYDKNSGKPEGFIDKMWIVTEFVEPTQTADPDTGDIHNEWQVFNYYVYVIVEGRRIRVKRLYQYPDNKTGFVVISDNPDWEQEWLPIEDVHELWLFKRKLDWDAAPPRRFEITVKPPTK